MPATEPSARSKRMHELSDENNLLKRELATLKRKLALSDATVVTLTNTLRRRQVLQPSPRIESLLREVDACLHEPL